MRKPIHILQVVHSLAVGGTERVVCSLANAFNYEEFRTSVCCLDELGAFGRNLNERGVPVHIMNRKPGLDLALVSRLHSLYVKEEVDIVHAHQYTPYFYAATAGIWAGSIPLIFTEHGRHWPDHLRIRRAIVNQFLRATTSAYTAVSEFSRDCLVRYEKMPANKIRVIYNGIELNGKNTSSGARDEMRAELGASKDDLVVVSVGRLDRVKDYGTLIRAFAKVLTIVPNAVLWIVGSGDEEYKKELVFLTHSLGIAGKVNLIGSRDDVNSLLLASDLFVLCSVTEATSMTILEAMAVSRAIVATATGGNPEIVAHGKTGLLVPVGDVCSIAESVIKLLQNTKLRDSMGQAGRVRAETQFLLKDKFQQYRELYRGAVNFHAVN